MRKILSSVGVILLTVSCSTKAPEDPGKKSPPKSPKIVGSADEAGISFDAKQLANEMESNYVTEVKFSKGSADLTANARRAIMNAMTAARKGNSLASAKLITWADSEMPSDKKVELSDEQVELAKKRNDSLSRYIQSIDREIDIDRISMAERPQGLKKMVPNETARIQKSLDEAGIPETGEKKKALGKASRSIVIFVGKE